MKVLITLLVTVAFVSPAFAADIVPPAKHLSSCDYALQMADHDLAAYRGNYAGAIEQSQRLADENAALKKELEALKTKAADPAKE